ncbi:hypothetical protein [Photobacterium damselae]|uniref:hypothetical protein n=1 Tax=Photobacterium damselae TaxID=38293 RepID=UPI004068DEBC
MNTEQTNLSKELQSALNTAISAGFSGDPRCALTPTHALTSHNEVTTVLVAITTNEDGTISLDPCLSFKRRLSRILCTQDSLKEELTNLVEIEKSAKNALDTKRERIKEDTQRLRDHWSKHFDPSDIHEYKDRYGDTNPADKVAIDLHIDCNDTTAVVVTGETVDLAFLSGYEATAEQLKAILDILK